jgi:hypothetical protein
MQFAGLEECGSQGLTASRNQVNVLLLLDKSSSMENQPVDGDDTTLWEATKEALSTTLTDASDEIAFGLQLYPARDEGGIPQNCYPDCCEMPSGMDIDVPIEQTSEARDSILAKLDFARPGGGTPTAAALERAYHYFKSGEGADLKGSRFVLLATDGGPNCNDDTSCDLSECTLNIDGDPEDPEEKCHLDGGVNCCASNVEGCLDDGGVMKQIDLLRSVGVDTFVVGLTGTEAYAEQLNEFAVAGGRPRKDADEDYYRVDAEGSSAGLIQVFEEITRTLVQSCEIQLTDKPPDLNEVNVAVDCTVVPRAGADSSMGGGAGSSAQNESTWDFDTSTNPPTAIISGPLCDTIEEEGVGRVDVLYGCPVVR